MHHISSGIIRGARELSEADRQQTDPTESSSAELIRVILLLEVKCLTKCVSVSSLPTRHYEHAPRSNVFVFDRRCDALIKFVDIQTMKRRTVDLKGAANKTNSHEK